MPAAWRRAVSNRFQRWLRRRGPLHPPMTIGYRQIYILPTGFGALAGLLMLAMLMGSLNFNNSLGLLTTFLVAGIAVLSMHMAHRQLDRVEIVGTEAAPVFAGDDLRVCVQLRDTGGRAHQGLRIEAAGARPGIGIRLEPFCGHSAGLHLPTQQRGRLPAPRMKLRCRYPLGWFEAWTWFWPREHYRVWPRPAADAPPLPRSGRSSSSPSPGDESDEFHGLREWQENDPLHRIAWKASQRHDQLLARQFTRPTVDELTLRLDQAPGDGLEARIGVVARWVLDADRLGADYALDLGRSQIASGRGDAQRIRCLDALADFE